MPSHLARTAALFEVPVWQFLRQNRLANRVFYSYDAIVDVCCDAWNALLAIPERVASITSREWARVSE